MSNFVAKTRALMEQMSEAQDKPVDKAHFCATHVEHLLFGAGTCVSEAHAEPDESGHVSWYTVQFADGMRKMPTNELKITMGEEHMHSKKKPMKEAEVAEANIKHPNQQKLDVHEPEKDELTAKDFEMLRKNKKVEKTVDTEKEEKKMTNEAKAKMSHQASTTMKHIANPTPGEAKAAKDIKPGIAGYRDRVAMLKSAQARGGLKKEEVETENFDLVDITTTYEMTEQVAIPKNPSFENYLDAVSFLINNDSEEIQQEIISLAQEAFANKEIDVLIKAELQAMNEAGAIKMPTASGMKVMGTRYGNSAEAERNRTKKFVDTLSGPSKSAMQKLDKPAKAKK
jgi:hypothetical protein